MNRKITIILFLIIIFLITFFILNKETTRKIAINYKTIEYKIPTYLKLFDFFDRHFAYKYLVKNLSLKDSSIEDKIYKTTLWVNLNIKKVPEGVDVVDYHPLTIVKRRLGVQDQFNDILSVLLVYQDIDSFFIKKFKNISHPLTFFKIDDYWSVIDPYHGFFFINENQTFASIEELKTTNWEIVNLKKEKKDHLNLVNNYKKHKSYYQKIFNYIKSTKQIESTNIYERGGRSYIQKPLNRLKYEIYQLLN